MQFEKKKKKKKKKKTRKSRENNTKRNMKSHLENTGQWGPMRVGLDTIFKHVWSSRPSICTVLIFSVVVRYFVAVHICSPLCSNEVGRLGGDTL